MLRIVIALLAAIAMVPVATPSIAADDDSSAQYITPYDAIWRAAADPDHGVRGTFKLTVRAWGQQRDTIYVNSEDDYRDQRNISIDLLPGAQAGVTEKLGAPDTLKGKSILVKGVAKRVKIWFVTNGQQTSKYYYQTHIQVSDASQIRLAD